MIIKSFYEKSDYEQYPENEYIRDKTPGALIGITKTWPHSVYAYRSRWWYDFEYLHLKDMLLYNAGVYFSFGDKHYQLELTNDMLDEITAEAPPLSFLKVGIYVEDGVQSVIVKDIPILIDDNLYYLEIKDASVYPFTPISFEYLDDHHLRVNSTYSPFYFQLIFKPKNLPRGRSIKIVDTFTDPADKTKIALYSSHLTYLAIQNGLPTEIQIQSNDLRNITNLIYQTVNYDYYLNKNILIKSNHVSMFFKPVFYTQDENYVATSRLDLYLLPVEYAYALYSIDKYKDIISLGTFHRINPKTNMFLLFKNSIPFPAFTEHTLYKICDEGSGAGDTPLGDMIGYDVFNYVQYSYPYQLLLLMFDQTFLTTELSNLDYDTIYEYVWFDDINKIIYEQDFTPTEWKTIDFRNTPRSFITDFKREGLILYSIQKWPKRYYDTNIKIDFVQLPTKISVHFYDPIYLDNDFEIVYYHKRYYNNIVFTHYDQRPYIGLVGNIKFDYQRTHYYIHDQIFSNITIKDLAFRGTITNDDNTTIQQGVYNTNISLTNHMTQPGSFDSQISFTHKMIDVKLYRYYSGIDISSSMSNNMNNIIVLSQDIGFIHSINQKRF